MTNKEFYIELEKLNIFLTNIQKKKLEDFYELLIEWNEKINLTTITNKEEVYLKHYYDSLTIIRDIDLNNYNNLCDLGTGAGFPGIVLKIVFPKLEITLIDSLLKRINYLNDIINILGLTGIKTIHSRGEEYSKKNREKFDIVIARAVTNLSILSEISIPMIKTDGLLIAMKANCEEELNQSKQILNDLQSKIVKIDRFKLIKEESNRTIIIIQKENITPSRFPRSYKEIKNNCKSTKNNV